jgi:hypothetical protein
VVLASFKPTRQQASASGDRQTPVLRAGRRGAATAVAGQPPRVGGFEESAGVLCSVSLAEVRSAQNRRSMFSWAFFDLTTGYLWSGQQGCLQHGP